jgi:iron complex outermembrane recepter protein
MKPEVATLALATGLACPLGAWGQAEGEAAGASGGVVVSATRSERNSFDVPVSIDRVDAQAIRDGQVQNNLSESLVRVPGVVVQNRNNYAQDLQISSRGFGARAQFGVRGVRLYADGIPATAPDGQGQTSNFDLGSAERIEVMRGPFSSLYGNASGGVIQVFTEDGPPEPTASVSASAGSWGTSRLGLKLGGESGAVNYIGSASRFDTDGYRDHSAATRDLLNAKAKIAAGDATRVTLVANSVSVRAQDPQGLSRAQVDQDRRQVDPGSLTFDTRKSVRQDQLGASVEQRLSAADTVRLAAYGGRRDVEQFLSIPLAAQNPATSSGGVVDLDRGYYGLDLRWTRSMRLGDAPLTFAAGVGHDRQKEHRQGFINSFGSAGAPKRDENDTVWSTDVYTQADWKFAPRWLASAGVRRSVVHFESSDYYVAPGNPDDSGRARFGNTSPALGLTFSATPSLNLYGNFGRGFETPTFAELAYRSGGGTGLNFDLQPSTSTHAELGAKAFTAAGQRLTAAVFRVDTKNEIVIDTASGGRTIFKNAGGTERRGAEASWSGRASASVSFLAVATWIDARYSDAFASGSPPATVPAGNRLPGIPRRTAFTELAWSPSGPAWHTALEARYSDRVYVSDANAETAPPYTVFNWRLVFEQRSGRWLLNQFLRVDNLGDKRYIGSVVVGDANGRFYEPAPTRGAVIGATAQMRF